MKKILSAIYIILLTNLCVAQNWIRIHDALIDRTKIITINSQRALFFQTWGITGAPFIGCSDSTIFRTYRININSNITYKPYEFLSPFICTDPVSESCVFIAPMEFDVSNSDSNFVIKYSQSLAGNFCSPPYINKIITSAGISSPGDTLSAKIIRVSPFNDNNIFSVINNHLFKSADRGINWTFVTGSSGNLRDVVLNPYDENFIYIISSQDQNTMLVSTDGGVNFNINASGFSSLASSIYFKSKDTLFTYNGSDLYKSVDKGFSWNLFSSGAANFNCLEFHPTRKNIVYAGFGNLGLYISTNGAQSFSIYNNTFTPSNSVRAILKARPDEDSVYVVTDRGVYLTYDQYVTGITHVASEVPEEFYLSNNYPNPFNPKTIINYVIPSNVKGQMSNVKLIVFNAMGQEIAALVNENQNAGSYTVEFEASDLPSGIYFYKLEAGEFTKTKRMILLK